MGNHDASGDFTACDATICGTNGDRATRADDHHCGQQLADDLHSYEVNDASNGVTCSSPTGAGNHDASGGDTARDAIS